MSKCKCVYATARNTPAVRSGHVLGGYVKELCDFCEQRAEEYRAKEAREQAAACLLRLNLNDKVKVRLTAAGAQIYNRHVEQYPVSARPYSKSEGCELELQLWEAMNIFGPALYNGCAIPFQNNVMDWSNDDTSN